ncbi:hypothetical protein WG922_04910 [Ramlibacter sp. AN1015]|uniref:hypothetical protein n=1 Tax=Ramlibacter sp. AN1015 TaxID=3133428 RepID=UPI0030BF5BD4
MKHAIRSLATSPLALIATGAFAHEGHGLLGAHWHATDAFGLLLVGGLAALAIWWGRGGKK